MASRGALKGYLLPRAVEVITLGTPTSSILGWHGPPIFRPVDCSCPPFHQKWWCSYFRRGNEPSRFVSDVRNVRESGV